MMKENMQKALNEQLNAELYSAYLYFSMEAYCQSRNLTGMAHWFRIQAQEELFHVTKFFDYINDREGRVILAPVEGPPKEWGSPLAAFEKGLEHERIVTSRIENLINLANKENDHTTHNFLQWFVSEQVEEEANFTEIVGQLKIIGNSGSGLFMVDRELGQRIFVMPTASGTQAG